MGKRSGQKFTQEFVRDLPIPAERDQPYWDNDPRSPAGFGVMARTGGAKGFFLNYWYEGREKRFTIGAFPHWSVGAARAEAIELRKQIDRGISPAGEKRQRRTAPTVQDLINRYVKDHLPRKSLPLARINDEKRVLAEIGDKLGKHTKVIDVHHGDAQDLHRRITESGRPVRANRIATICHKMFELTLIPLPGENTPWRSPDMGNPFKRLERNHEEARERFFSQSELTAIGDALNKYSGPAADCVRLVMLTGARPGEAMRATWEEFDAESGYWIKPSAHTKQRKTHRLPLNPPAIELVNRLRNKRKGDTWVFPGNTSGEHLVTLWHVWKFVRKEAAIGKSARLYDLRHTFASVGAGGGLSLPIIGKLLGHTQQRTTQRYAHLTDDPLKEATEKIGNVIADRGKPGAEIISVKR